MHHAAASRDLSPIPLGDRAILASALRQAAAVEAEILVIERDIAARVHTIPEVRQLLTITNVGMLTAAALWASLGDPHRFADSKQVARYAGLDPSFVQRARYCGMAGSARTATRCSGRCWSKRPRALVGATTALWVTYRRKKAQLGHKKSVVALARKLLVVAWRMLLTGEDYRTSKPRQVTPKHRLLDRLATHTSSPVAELSASITQLHLAYTKVRHRRVVRTSVPA